MHGIKQSLGLSAQHFVSHLCTQCGGGMRLALVAPDKPGYDLHTFQCTACANTETTSHGIEFRAIRRN